MPSIALRRLSAVFIVALALHGVALHAAQACLAPDAIWRTHSVGDPQIAPDGRSVIYVDTWSDVMDDLNYSNLRQVSTDGTSNHAVTEGKYNDSSPRWSPEGSRIAYISNRDGGQAIHVLTFSTGKERTLAAGAEGLSNIAWSPDGKLLAYMAYVASAPAWAPAMPPRPAGAHWAPEAVAVTSLRWTFDGLGVLKPGATRIFVVPASGGTPRQLSRDPYQHTFYLADPELVWSRDSKLVLAPAVNAPDGWAVYDGNQIYGFPVDGGDPRQLTHLKGYGLQVRPSPDGSRIAFAGYDWKGHSYHVSKLYVMDAAGGEPREITTGWDRDVNAPVWSKDSRGIYFLSDDRGDVNLYETSIEGDVKKVTTGHHHLAPISLAGSRGAVIYSTPTQPPALATLTLDAPHKLMVIADPNRQLMAGCRLSDAEEIWYESFDGRKIQGWILKPPGFDPARHYALLVSMHGGPHGAYGNTFNDDLQMFADHGYVLLFVNPRGSTGYGEEFGNIIQHKWPGDDIKDVLTGVDVVLGKGYVDANRLAVIGGSGGGLMTAWMIGHSDRFRAAVALYPVANWFTHVGSDDNGFYIASVYRKGMPWDYPEDYITHSPLFYAKNFKTPTLIMTGEDDWRTPITQSQELFRALKVRGVETVLVRVPGEAHGIRKRPSHQIATIVNSTAWLDKYIDPRPR